MDPSARQSRYLDMGRRSVAIVVIVLVVDQTALTAGFYYDDYNHLQAAGRLSWPEFWAAIAGIGVHKYFVFYRPCNRFNGESNIFCSDLMLCGTTLFRTFSTSRFACSSLR